MSPEEAVRRTLALYPRYHDARDVDGYVGLFATNGAFAGANGERHEGHDALRQFISKTYGSQAADRRTKHLCGNSLIDVNGGEATAETDFVAYERLGDQAWRVHTIGRYHDRLALEGGEWRFVERKVVTVGPSTPR